MLNSVHAWIFLSFVGVSKAKLDIKCPGVGVTDGCGLLGVRAKAKNLQMQRERESCWAQINFTNTDMSFDNSLFAISTKMTQEDSMVTLDSGPRKRPTSASFSPEPPEFSTFRACQ
nr:protein HIDE1 isoform X7 [Rattus norvegicus]